MNTVVFGGSVVCAVVVLVLAFRVLHADSCSHIEKWALLLGSLGISVLGVLSLLSPTI